MPITPKIRAVASGPIVFTQADGSQLSISPYVLAFQGGALLVPTPFAAATQWLNHLVATGFIKEEPPPAPTVLPPAPPVLTLTSASPGEWGNNIVATIVYDETQLQYTVTVSATISFELDTTTMASVLGTDVLAPRHPGPVFAVASSIVSGSTPKNTTQPFTMQTTTLAINKSDNSGPAFQLQARKFPPSGHPITVAISNAVNGSSKFTLTLGWTGTSSNLGLSVPQDPQLSTTRALLTDEIGYLVDVVYNGGKPKSGAFSLTGGTDGARAQTSTPAVK